MSKNMVMISVDDLFNVNKFRDTFGVAIKTPNFDRLMSMGTTYENAYASTPLCSPSRTSILAGKSPFTTGVYRNDEAWYDKVDANSTLPAILKIAGWYTASFGKGYHQDLPDDVAARLFDTYVPESGSPWDRDTITVAKTVEFLQNYKGAKPLFTMVGLRDPHTPYNVPQEFLDLYPQGQITVPVWTGDDPPDFIKAILGITGVMPDNIEEIVRLYLANVSEMDARLGELLNAIDASGIDTNIILYSDHGYSLGDHDSVGKFSLWEQAVNAPLIIVDPDGEAGVRNHEVVSFLDIMPTVLEMLGVSLPSGLEGTSLLSGGSGYAISNIYGSTSIRVGDWRYTRYEDGSVELFNVLLDPSCSDNLHGDPAVAQTESRMLGILDARLAEIGVTFTQDFTVHETSQGDTDYFVRDTDVLTNVVDDRGHDNVIVTLASQGSLPSWAEDALIAHQNMPLHFRGNDKDNLIICEGGNSVVRGGAGDDVIFGNSGKDTLIGGLGSDELQGGRGDDNIRGDVGDDLLIGGSGRDTVIGGAGSDRMLGGKGSDLYHVDSVGDVIVELAGEGTDEVRSSVSLKLGLDVENLVLLGDGDLTGRGNGLSNVITGNSGDNFLDGRWGADILMGGEGADTFHFSSALGVKNVDYLTDFDVAVDMISLSATIFAGLAPGELGASAFHIGAFAPDGAVRIIYDTATGALLYDMDGSGSASAIRFAMIDPGLDLTHMNFIVV